MCGPHNSLSSSLGHFLLCFSCYFQTIPLDWWPLTRDSIAYGVTVAILICVMHDERVEWYEALILVSLYAVYLAVMYFDKSFQKCAKGKCASECRKILAEHYTYVDRGYTYVHTLNTCTTNYHISHTGGVKQARSRSRSSNCSIHTKNSNEKDPGTHNETLHTTTLLLFSVFPSQSSSLSSSSSSSCSLSSRVPPSFPPSFLSSFFSAASFPQFPISFSVCLLCSFALSQTSAELVENRICQNMASIQLNGGLNNDQAKASSNTSTTPAGVGGGGAVAATVSVAGGAGVAGGGGVVAVAPVGVIAVDNADAESQIAAVAAAAAAAAAVEEPEQEGYSLLTYPKGTSCFAQFTWLIIWPIHLLFRIAIPDCKKAKNNKIFPLTFIMCIVWIGSLSYVVAWMITIIGKSLMETEIALQWVPDSLTPFSLLLCRRYSQDTRFGDGHHFPGRRHQRSRGSFQCHCGQAR